MLYSIYCDESCYLENDGIDVMVLGAVTCPYYQRTLINKDIRDIKEKWGFSREFELKWSRVLPAVEGFYLELVDYLFDSTELCYRGLIVNEKNKLSHGDFNQSHDDWYYKMYFTMLKQIFSPVDQYKIFIDIKDTKGGEKIESLHNVLSNNMYDFSRSIIENIKLVHSHEVELIQLADFFTGALAYCNRGLKTSQVKLNIIERIKNKSSYNLKHSTLLRESKFNLFVWSPSQGGLDV